ncbi:hypothetical protein JCM10908_006647 [Rhodotorula pacifica]|uniref:uncharacterized protein n=1 Tax=Rhodotorula pacifica TaxID=1495444 RepID=UPI003174C1D3
MSHRDHSVPHLPQYGVSIQTAAGGTASDSDDEDIAPEPTFPEQGSYREQVQFLHDKAERRVAHLSKEAIVRAKVQAATILSAAEAWERDVLAPDYRQKVSRAKRFEVERELQHLCSTVRRMQLTTAVNWPRDSLMAPLAERLQYQANLASLVDKVMVTVRQRMKNAIWQVTKDTTASAKHRQQEANRWRTKMLKFAKVYADETAYSKERICQNLGSFDAALDKMPLTGQYRWPTYQILKRIMRPGDFGVVIRSASIRAESTPSSHPGHMSSSLEQPAVHGQALPTATLHLPNRSSHLFHPTGTVDPRQALHQLSLPEAFLPSHPTNLDFFDPTILAHRPTQTGPSLSFPPGLHTAPILYDHFTASSALAPHDLGSWLPAQPGFVVPQHFAEQEQLPFDHAGSAEPYSGFSKYTAQHRQGFPPPQPVFHSGTQSFSAPPQAEQGAEGGQIHGGGWDGHSGWNGFGGGFQKQ